MTVMEHLLDTAIHKSIILNVGLKMVNYLEEIGEYELAEALCIRLIVHDDSKTRDDEISALTSIEDKGNMENPEVLISSDSLKAIEIHWKNNRHHPEHFSDYHNMEEVDIIEMVCDWYARSIQKETDFFNFVKTRQENRFHFDKEFFDKVIHYCNIIASLRI